MESERENGEKEKVRDENKREIGENDRENGGVDSLSLAPVDKPCWWDSRENEHDRLKLRCNSYGTNSTPSPSGEMKRLTSHSHSHRHGDGHQSIEDNGHMKRRSWMGRICQSRRNGVFVYEGLFILSALAVYKFYTQDMELSWWPGVYTSAVASRPPPPSFVPCDVDWLAFRLHYPNPDGDYTWNHTTGLPSACSAESSARHEEDDRPSGSRFFLRIAGKFFLRTAQQSPAGNDSHVESGSRDNEHMVNGSIAPAPQQQPAQQPGKKGEGEVVVQDVQVPHVDSFLMTKELLSRVALNGSLIVLILGNSAWEDLIFNWVISANRVGMGNYLVVAVDEPLLRTLDKRGIPVAVPRRGLLGPESSAWKSPIAYFREMQKIKPASIIDVLEAGFDVLMADADQVWFRNPLPYFLSHPEPDILSSTDCPFALFDDAFLRGTSWLDAVDPGPWPPCDGEKYHFNVGLMLVRRREPSLRLLREWASRLSGANNEAWDQQVFNDMLKVILPSATSKLVLPSGIYYRLFDSLLLIGALPQGLFVNGLSFFYSGLPLPLPIPPSGSSSVEPGPLGRAGGRTSGLETGPDAASASGNGSVTVTDANGTGADAVVVGPGNNIDEAFSHRFPTPYVMHSTYIDGGHSIKRMRLRDCALWDMDPPSYLFPSERGFLRYQHVIPDERLDEAASNPEKNLSLRRLQLGWLRDALAIAFVLDRILIMPTLFGEWPMCCKVEMWKGKVPGARNRGWTDYVLNIVAMDENGDGELIRGSDFLSSRWISQDLRRSRLNVAVLEGEEVASLSLPLTHSTPRVGRPGNGTEKEGKEKVMDSDPDGADITVSRPFDRKLLEVAGTTNLTGELSDDSLYCVNGSLLASEVGMEKATRVKITRNMTDVQVASCFGPFGHVKLLEFSTMDEVFGGFVNVSDRDLFVSKWGKYARGFPDDNVGLLDLFVG